jgi:hypothetical protein
VLAVQRRLEEALCAEVDRLTALVAAQQALLLRWQPLVSSRALGRGDRRLARRLGLEECSRSSSSRHSSGSSSSSVSPPPAGRERGVWERGQLETETETETEAGDEEGEGGRTSGASPASDSYAACSPRWMQVSSPATPAAAAAAAAATTPASHSPHQVARSRPAGGGGIAGGVSRCAGSPSRHGAGQAEAGRGGGGLDYGSYTSADAYSNAHLPRRACISPPVPVPVSVPVPVCERTPFREILSLFDDPLFGSPESAAPPSSGGKMRSSSSGSVTGSGRGSVHFPATTTTSVHEVDAYDRSSDYHNPSSYRQRYHAVTPTGGQHTTAAHADSSPLVSGSPAPAPGSASGLSLSECDTIQAELMQEVNHILTTSPNGRRSRSPYY